jgi:tryptophan-rich sensory protein
MGYSAAWAVRRTDRHAFRWLLPLLVWLPITTLLKTATL